MKHGKRSFAVALGLCMLLGALTPAALAGSACPHGHENCGYQAAEEGQPCSVEAAHIHDAACGYAEAAEAAPEIPCTHAHDAACGGLEDAALCAHVHDAACGYAPAALAAEAAPCAFTHAHDASCGYAAAKAELPCTQECELCKAAAQTQPTRAPALGAQAVKTLTHENSSYTLYDDGTAALTDGDTADDGSINVPATVTDELGGVYTVVSIADDAFTGAQFGTITGFSLPEGLVSVGARAFAYVYIPAALRIPDSVKSIGEGAFEGGLYEKLAIGKGLTAIPARAFAAASLLSSVTLSDATTAIDAEAFTDSPVKKVEVTGADGCLDTVIGQVKGLKNATVSYNDPNAKTDVWLQEQIDASTGPTVITIDSNLRLENPVIIPSGKDITLTDDGSARKMSSPYSRTLFQIRSGGVLTIRTTGGDELLVLQGGESTFRISGSIATVSGTLNLEGGTLRGGTIGGWQVGAVLLQEGAKLNMSGGVIEDTVITNTGDPLTAPVIVAGGAEFRMSGGSIRNNNSQNNVRDSSGGVLVYGWNKGGFAGRMWLSGDAEITGNSSNHGGGIFLIGEASLEMSGGSVTYNTALKMGGGVCVAGASYGGDTDWNCAFTMNGGTISHNTAGYMGGGIYLNSNFVTLNSGYIEYNAATYGHGGGVYVSTTPYKLHLYNALITENSASYLGGGLWFCPTGDGRLHVTSGAAVFDNTAEAGGAGDDFVSVLKQGKAVSLADRALGGGEVKWYRDGGLTDTPADTSFTGQVDDGAARFDAAAPGEALSGISSGSQNYALKAVLSEAAKALARERAALFIRYNSSPRGGGIGSNGSVEIGVAQQEWSLRVTKAWADVPETERKPVVIRLLIDGRELDTATLSGDNDWTAEFAGLPNPDSLNGLSIAVLEEGTEYLVEYGALQRDDAAKTLSITVTNFKKPAPTGALTISKTVNGSGGDTAKDFSFTVSFSDGGTYDYTGSRTGSIKSGGSISLRHGQSVTIAGLPVGTGYTVTEADYGREGYTSSSSGASGKIVEGTVTAAFTNSRTAPPATGSKAPNTGDTSAAVVCLALLLVSGCGLVAGGAKYRSNRGAN